MRREIHLINNLKINLLFDNNIINFKKIVIDIVNKSIIINNINAIITLKIRLTKNVVQKLIHL